MIYIFETELVMNKPIVFALQKINGIINLFVGAVKIQISELKEQYRLKAIAYQELESLNFVVDNAAIFASIAEANLEG